MNSEDWVDPRKSLGGPWKFDPSLQRLKQDLVLKVTRTPSLMVAVLVRLNNLLRPSITIPSPEIFLGVYRGKSGDLLSPRTLLEKYREPVTYPPDPTPSLLAGFDHVDIKQISKGLHSAQLKTFAWCFKHQRSASRQYLNGESLGFCGKTLLNGACNKMLVVALFFRTFVVSSTPMTQPSSLVSLYIVIGMPNYTGGSRLSSGFFYLGP
ncbi:hypothetical protein BDN72DRAFT_854822 [Pluteus cervinus]|uniref:Uncharacterized protein n=1 Tax=Pluteus cervinus TaxID=181527 RepID=A0ACD3B6D4_9AGAR|nr:hypothetical protein BDN72DRAFT_854822 [Pluteus cervinus]